MILSNKTVVFLSKKTKTTTEKITASIKKKTMAKVKTTFKKKSCLIYETTNSL